MDMVYGRAEEAIVSLVVQNPEVEDVVWLHTNLLKAIYQITDRDLARKRTRLRKGIRTLISGKSLELSTYRRGSLHIASSIATVDGLEEHRL